MKKISIRTLSISAIGIGFISLALRIISLFFFYDDTGYYKVGAILPIIANAILALSIIFFLAVSIFGIDKKQSIEPTGKLSQYATLLPMGALIFRVLRVFATPFNDTVVNKYLMAVSAIIAAIFFFLMFFAKRSYKNITFYMGIGALLYVMLSWMCAYFDFFIPINSTDKIFFYLACAGALIFIFNEMCACYGFVRAKFYYFSLYTSIIILLVSPISALIGYFCGAIKGYITLEADVFFVALLVYAVTRLMDAQNSKIVIEENKEKAEIELPSEAQENISDDSE